MYSFEFFYIQILFKAENIKFFFQILLFSFLMMSRELGRISRISGCRLQYEQRLNKIFDDQKLIGRSERDREREVKRGKDRESE